LSSSTTTSSSYGRRLFERAVDDDHINLRNAHVASELMREGPLVGVTLAACGALCEALRRNDSNTDPRAECKAYAFRRIYPDDDSNLAVECHLLYHSGICTPIDFAATMYSRKYTSSGTCKNPTSYASAFASTHTLNNKAHSQPHNACCAGRSILHSAAFKQTRRPRDGL